MKTYHVKVNYEFETNANSKEEAINNVTEEISNSLESIRDHAEVEIEEV